jgi:molybdopterin molybdotransferase
MKENIPLEEARELLLANCGFPEEEDISLEESLGRVLSVDLRAEENIPPFARSPYDGYAFRAEDTFSATRENPAILEIIEEVPAGYAPSKQVLKGQAVKILTGAPIPAGADAVIKYEETELNGKLVSVFASFKAGENIVPAGEDIAKDEIIAAEGTVISPPLLGIMASLGITKVPVFKRPRIALISTGDELLDINEPLRPGKIRTVTAIPWQLIAVSWGRCRLSLELPKIRHKTWEI